DSKLHKNVVVISFCKYIFVDINYELRLEIWQMKNLIILAFVLLSSVSLSNLKAQDVSKKNSILFSYGADSRGFSLSYETRLFNFSDKDRFILKGFVGYGFNSSNWSDRGEVQEPGSFPGSSWRMSTYFPFENHKDAGRALYYLGDLKQYTLGLEVSGRLGKRKHFFEIGYGIALDYFTRDVNFYADRKTLGNTPTFAQLKEAKGSKFANHYYGRMGYRFVANNGLTLGIGASLIELEGLFTHFYAIDEYFTPYLSLGYSF
ncbi:MAG: hypothetical protein Q4A64_04130, partial [Porphyromonadaceae bacterium]|nr:hypothetical protein [Porphyromonadaceae bacterium]